MQTEPQTVDRVSRFDHSNMKGERTCWNRWTVRSACEPNPNRNRWWIVPIKRYQMAADDVPPICDRYAMTLTRVRALSRNIDTVPKRIRYALWKYYDQMVAATYTRENDKQMSIQYSICVSREKIFTIYQYTPCYRTLVFHLVPATLSTVIHCNFYEDYLHECTTLQSHCALAPQVLQRISIFVWINVKINGVNASLPLNNG